MSVAIKSAPIYFSVKGQVVIPRHLRKEFAIEEGTRAYVEATPDGILIKPVTALTIRRLRGILKRSPDAQSFTEEWAQHKQTEKKLEDAKYARSTSGI
jgi:AbrB family looped-hinge helix DNA binding protein